MADGATSTDDWDILQDLQFLIATDDQLHEDLSTVCDLFESESCHDDDNSGDTTTTAATTTTTTAGGRKRRVRVNHSKAELTQLRAQVEELKRSLDRAKGKTAAFDMTLWEKAARRERIDLVRCRAENQELRDAVDERASFIESMKRVLYKKPRWTTLPDASWSEEWQSYKLAAQQSLRVAAIHAIADRQYHRQATAFIQAGIVDLVHDHVMATPVTLSNGDVIAQCVHHVNLPLPRHAVSAMCWHTLTGRRRTSPLPDNAYETFETIDDHTVYERFCHTRDGVTGHSNNIRKHYPEEDRDVIVWRTVLEDALVPHMSKGAVDDTWGWLVISRHPDDETRCRLTGLVNIPLKPLVQNKGSSSSDADNDFSHTTDVILTALRSCSIVDHSDGEFDMSEIAFPAVRTFLERGKFYETEFKASLSEIMANLTTCHLNKN
ncbi:Aste57867_14620 [Aphanomyces stellatus]|uniref:Aste57867_14620 protein n=1 Tax=Aphanomyces stellatus TaxID=120398 RepID=A0A485L1Y7_9STRA|nr:hypothetical protein As57867_014565 [Aphanomyces stellatus]VFT91439.1 Aste57867_14620 [Aphanomyces stellatus]